MATLYVENFPDDRYEALRQQAKRNGKSIAAEVIELIARSVPTKKEVDERWQAIRRLEQIRNTPSPGPGPFPTAEEMVREDRDR